MKKALRILLSIASATVLFAACEEEAPLVSEEYEVSPTELTSPARGGEFELTVTSNVAWTATVSDDAADWVAIDTTAGSGNATVKVTVSENIGEEGACAPERKGAITFLFGTDEIKVEVAQDAESVIFAALGDTLDVAYAGGKVSVDLSHNVDYDINIPEEAKAWISYQNPTKAAATDALMFTVAKNLGAERTADIAFTSGDLKDTVTIRQAAFPTPKDAVSIVIPDADFQYVEGNKLMQFYGYTEDQSNFVTLAFVGAETIIGSHTNVTSVSGYSYVKIGKTSYQALEICTAPIVVESEGDTGYSCKAEMYCSDETLYQVTFHYVPHLSNDTNKDVEVEFTTDEVNLDASTVARSGYYALTAQSDNYMAKILVYVEKPQTTAAPLIPAGTYTVSSENKAGTIAASTGLTAQGQLVPSYLGKFNERKTGIEDCYFIVEGSASITDSDNTNVITLDAKNSYGKSVKIKMTYRPHMQYDTNRDFETEFSKKDVSVDDSNLKKDGSIGLLCKNDSLYANFLFYIDTTATSAGLIPAGEYPVASTKNPGTLFASTGISAEGTLTPSCTGTRGANGIEDCWWIIGGKATVTDNDGENTIVIDGVNSYGKSINVTFKVGEKAAAGWGAWEEYKPFGDATAHTTFSYYFGNKTEYTQQDIKVFVRKDTGNPNLRQVKFQSWGAGYVCQDGIDLVADWNAETNLLRISSQKTGYVNATEGEIFISDPGIGLGDESYYSYYQSTYDSVHGQFILQVVYQSEKMLGTGYCMGGNIYKEVIAMDGMPDYTFVGWIAAFEEDTKNEKASIEYDVTIGGDDLEGMRYAVAPINAVVTSGRIDKAKVNAILSQAETQYEYYSVLELDAPGDYIVMAASVDANDQLTGELDCQQYHFENSNDYEKIGDAVYTEGIFGYQYEFDGTKWDVEVEANIEEPSIIRVKNMYGSACPFTQGYPSCYREDNYVYFYIPSSTKASVLSDFPQYLGANYDGLGDLEVAALTNGTFSNNVLTFPTRGLVFYTPDGGGYYGNNTGTFKLEITPVGEGGQTSSATKAVRNRSYRVNPLCEIKTQFPAVNQNVVKKVNLPIDNSERVK